MGGYFLGFATSGGRFCVFCVFWGSGQVCSGQFEMSAASARDAEFLPTYNELGYVDEQARSACFFPADLRCTLVSRYRRDREASNVWLSSICRLLSPAC